MKLLYESIKEDGYTMPIVVYPLGDGEYEIVDGYHRYTTMLLHRDIYEREGGKLPCSIIDKDVSNRMASTIPPQPRTRLPLHRTDDEHRGRTEEGGMSDQWIMKEIGMDADELLRFKQLSGLAEVIQGQRIFKSNRTMIKNEQERQRIGQTLPSCERKKE